MMPLLRLLAMQAARRLASDPEMRRRAVEVAQRLRPQAEAVAGHLRDAARTAPPLADPVAFGRELRDRMMRRKG